MHPTQLEIPNVDNAAGDPTWESPSPGGWGSSSEEDDDDNEFDEDLDAVVKHVVLGAGEAASSTAPSAPGPPRAFGKQSIAGPKPLSMHSGIQKSQAEWIGRQKEANEQKKGWARKEAPRRSSSVSSGSLDSISALVGKVNAKGLRETPVPLPGTVLAVTGPRGQSVPVSAAVTTPTPFPSSMPASAPRPWPLAPNSSMPVSGGTLAPTAPTSTPVPLPPPPVKPAQLSSQPNGQRMTRTSDTDSDSAKDTSRIYQLRPGKEQLIKSPILRGIKPKSNDTLSKENAIEFTLDRNKRPYNLYEEASGRLVPTRGALIPGNYKLHDDPTHPFICPVRDCRRTLSHLNSLAGHFGAAHRYCTFNDNHDGTLTKIGTYRSSMGRSPGIVVSQIELSPDAPPPAEPCLPPGVKRPRDSPGPLPKSKRQSVTGSSYGAVASPSTAPQSSKTDLQHVPRDPPPDLPTPVLDRGMHLIRLLHPASRIPGRRDIGAMLRHSRKRNLPVLWIKRFSGTKLDAQMFAIALAYCVGDRIEGELACTKSQVPGGLLCLPCVRPPLDSNLRANFSMRDTCVGCAYVAHITGKPSNCAFAAGSLAEDDLHLSFRIYGAPSPMSSNGPASTAGQGAVVTEQTLASTRERRQVKQRSMMNPIQADKSAPPNLKSDHVSGVYPGQFGAPDFQMEDWEMAPGRLTSQDGSHNVAYSGAFLTSSKPITISPDVSFNVLTIRPGQIFNVQNHPDKMQVYSVAAGKVKVTTGGRVVELGPNGAFPVRPGESCIIANKLYFEAVVHCTMVKDYELAA